MKNCTAGNCKPDDDVAGVVALAESQFITGEYRDAKTTVKQAIGRNWVYRNHYPVELSYLFRASGRVAEHHGETNEYRPRLLDMSDTLHSNFPAHDAKVLSAPQDLADSRMKPGYPDNAIAIYSDAGKVVLAVGQNQIASLAKLRCNLLTSRILPDRTLHLHGVI